MLDRDLLLVMLHYCFKHCDCDINRSSLHCYNEEIDNLKSNQDPWSIIYYLLFITRFASRSRMKMASWRSACRMRYTKRDKEFVLRNVYSYKKMGFSNGRSNAMQLLCISKRDNPRVANDAI